MQPKENKLDLTAIISAAIKIPGVKVNRKEFLQEQFKDASPDLLAFIVADGPVVAGCSREELHKKANRIIKSRTAVSSGASFLAGIPGGLAMAATIPADILQFYGVALRMAQELAYLYGEEDMWCDSTLDADKVTNQLILYCGVMLGAGGACQAVRVMSAALAKQALLKLPKQALTKTIYYPVIKTILKFFGISVTKSTFAKGVSKAIPIIGGVVSGGITLASMLPMGNRLAKTLDKAHFDYTEADFEMDMNDIRIICEQEEKAEKIEPDGTIETCEETQEAPKEETASKEDILTQIQKAKQLHDDGILTDEEFSAIKTKLISQL
ncbi:MAG: SHOCT domain-containing protein [Clostridia bacterium]|nr:SHOCT domain-containing protein [Clostridia bacterium]